ncbi:SDR family oxidoreductase [Spongiibacter sp. KMU-166]|uniref:SDR family oxidoreductase n=1 Tax=Spongiibacter thalassae TaxID=2721624 RepID=A0ABX1GBD5_9GAMM|nr:SDR family NAD(P)-dependent oxidoreductase [Spongiibacter thalassae]NKI16475.1 SDR family oxidoreductase [Spongiibacter thalassae]
MKSLQDKVVLISGSGGGIGSEAARRFAEQGAVVFGCDLSAENQQATVDALAADGLTLHGSGSVDLGDPEQAAQWIDDAVARFGRIDILFNNASAARFGNLEDYSVDDWYFTTRNELDNVFFSTKFAWPHIPRGGVIINMGSTAAWRGTTATGKVAHSATKGAIVAMTRQLAAEGAKRGIRAVSISPGFIKTPGTAPFIANTAVKEQLLSGVLLDRLGEPSDVISMALYLASDQASFLTGSDFVVDGGMLAT